MQEDTVLQSTKNIQNNSEYKRRLLLNMLKERGIFFDLETKKIIDDRTSLETLLRILQNYHEALLQYQSVYDSWYIAYKLDIIWYHVLYQICNYGGLDE
jgi:hypothetical protein